MCRECEQEIPIYDEFSTYPEKDTQLLHLAARGNLWQGVVLKLIEKGKTTFPEVYRLAEQVTAEGLSLEDGTVDLSRRLGLPEELRQQIVRQVGRIQPAVLHLTWERKIRNFPE